MNRLTLTRRAALTSLALMPLLAACGNNDATPQVDPSASSYGTLRIGYGALREMRAVAHVYARALRQVGYSVELVDTDNSRAAALRGLMVPSANSATPTATLPDDEETERVNDLKEVEAQVRSRRSYMEKWKIAADPQGELENIDGEAQTQ